MAGTDDSTKITRAPMIETDDPLTWRLTIYMLVGGYVFLLGFGAYHGALAFFGHPGVYLRQTAEIVGATAATIGVGYVTVWTFKRVVGRVK